MEVDSLEGTETGPGDILNPRYLLVSQVYQYWSHCQSAGREVTTSMLERLFSILQQSGNPGLRD